MMVAIFLLLSYNQLLFFTLTVISILHVITRAKGREWRIFDFTNPILICKNFFDILEVT